MSLETYYETLVDPRAASRSPATAVSASPARIERRFDVLDFYRFPGAILVAWYHFMVLYYPIDDAVKIRIHDLLEPTMGLFFTLSGFVIMHAYGQRLTTWSQYTDYVQKRLARMYPLHLATFLLAVLWGYLALNRPEFFPRSAILPNLLLLHALNTTDRLTFDYPSWSISAEMFVYLLFPLFAIAMRWLKGFDIVFPLIAALAIGAFFQVFHYGDWMQASYRFGCLRVIPSFLAGMVVYRLTTVTFARVRTPIWAAHGFAIACVPLMLMGVPDGLMLAVMALLLFVLAAAEPVKPGVLSRPWPRALANASFGIYLIHALVAPLLLGAIPRWLGLDHVWCYALTPVALAATVALALLSYTYFEDPARRYLGALGRPRRKPRAA